MSWWFGGGGGGGNGGGGNYEEYMKQLEAERKAQRLEDKKEQDEIDAIADPAERKKANRQRYRCGADRYVALEHLKKWSEVAPDLAANPKHTTAGSGGMRGGMMSFSQDKVEFKDTDLMRQFEVDAELNDKVCIWQGDITRLEVDGIVNAANSSLMGGGGIDGAIHGAAGNMLQDECETLNGAETGETKITKGYKLPAAHVLHTVGPIGGGDAELESCYKTSLDLMLQHKLRSVAFCCVSTGIFGFPLVRATHIALRTIRPWLEQHKDKVDRIVFCVFRDIEVESYEKILPSYFPIPGYPEKQLPEGTDVIGPEAPRRQYGGMGGLSVGGGGRGAGAAATTSAAGTSSAAKAESSSGGGEKDETLDVDESA